MPQQDQAAPARTCHLHLSEGRTHHSSGLNLYPLGHLLEKELEEKIRTAIETLPHETRQVFELSRYEDMTYDEIAKRLGISVNTVKYHIKNAIRLLYSQLEPYLLLLLLLG